MRTDYKNMSRDELVVQLEGRDAMIDHLKYELNVAQKALENCANEKHLRRYCR
jgi:hypothetical protein